MVPGENLDHGGLENDSTAQPTDSSAVPSSQKQDDIQPGKKQEVGAGDVRRAEETGEIERAQSSTQSAITNNLKP